MRAAFFVDEFSSHEGVFIVNKVFEGRPYVGINLRHGNLVLDEGEGTLTIWRRTDLRPMLRDALGKLDRNAGEPPMSQAAEDVLAERRRQADEEGYVDADDDQWASGELALAASCYARIASWGNLYGSGDTRSHPPPTGWPWGQTAWNPKNPRRDLVRAAALIIAEIERLDRAAGRHASDCAVHNAPAYPPGPCDCGATS